MTADVLTFPASHPYLSHAIGLRGPADVDIWDVEALKRAKVRVVHVHFGFETKTPAELAAWITALHVSGIALIHTVHDLDNPHLIDQVGFHQAVEVLVRGSDSVLTLTDHAAAVTHHRYGVRPTVIPHPHVVPLEDILAISADPPADRNGIYVHAATIRPNLDVRLIERLAGVACVVGGMHIHIRDTADPAVAARLLALDVVPGVEVAVRERLSDAELWARISAARLVVLPYRWGTHSGLLEAAHDLGTPVAAPHIGAFVDQGAHLLDPADLSGSLLRAASNAPTVTVDERRTQQASLRAFHRDRYRGLVGAA